MDSIINFCPLSNYVERGRYSPLFTFSSFVTAIVLSMFEPVSGENMELKFILCSISRYHTALNTKIVWSGNMMNRRIEKGVWKTVEITANLSLVRKFMFVAINCWKFNVFASLLQHHCFHYTKWRFSGRSAEWNPQYYRTRYSVWWMIQIFNFMSVFLSLINLEVQIYVMNPELVILLHLLCGYWGHFHSCSTRFFPSIETLMYTD